MPIHLPPARRTLALLLLVVLLPACAAAPPSRELPAAPVRSPAIETQPPTPGDEASSPPTSSPTASLTPPPTGAASAGASETAPPAPPAPTLPPIPAATSANPAPEKWRAWPTVPRLTATARLIFQRGQELGNDAGAFTRIGDCQSAPNVFLGIYGTDRYYFTADYQYLQETVDWFWASYPLESIAARDGFGVASVLSPLMADRKLCETGETPLDCEYRLRKPAFAFIAMGTNWTADATVSFEKYLGEIIDLSYQRGVVPILITKADNIEKDHGLNESIARVAAAKDAPLFNAWRAIQHLPNHGLQKDNIYLTPEAWDARNFAALETLDALLRELNLLPAR